MVVTITTVRDCLNNMSTDEVADDTVTDKIADASAWVTDAGGNPADAAWGERACKYRASYLSFVVSNTYLQASMGPLNVREAWEQRAEHLKEQADAALRKELDTPKIITKKVKLLRKYSKSEQEKDPNVLELTVR